jgi:hypothetical protein
MYSSTLSLTSALDRGGWLTPRPGRFATWKEIWYPLCRRLGGSQGRSGRLRKISSPSGFDPRIVQLVGSAKTVILGHAFFPLWEQNQKETEPRCNICSNCNDQTDRAEEECFKLAHLLLWLLLKCACTHVQGSGTGALVVIFSTTGQVISEGGREVLVQVWRRSESLTCVFPAQ